MDVVRGDTISATTPSQEILAKVVGPARMSPSTMTDASKKICLTESTSIVEKRTSVHFSQCLVLLILVLNHLNVQWKNQQNAKLSVLKGVRS